MPIYGLFLRGRGGLGGRLFILIISTRLSNLIRLIVGLLSITIVQEMNKA